MSMPLELIKQVTTCAQRLPLFDRVFSAAMNGQNMVTLHYAKVCEEGAHACQNAYVTSGFKAHVAVHDHGFYVEVSWEVA